MYVARHKNGKNLVGRASASTPDLSISLENTKKSPYWALTGSATVRL